MLLSSMFEPGESEVFYKVRKSSSSHVEIWAMFTKMTMENVTYPLGTSHLHLTSLLNFYDQPCVEAETKEAGKLTLDKTMYQQCVKTGL